MVPKIKLGKMTIDGRKNEEYCSIFKCPVCGNEVIKPTGEGKRLTACSQRCSQIGKRRGNYKPYVIISGYKYIYAPNHPFQKKEDSPGIEIDGNYFINWSEHSLTWLAGDLLLHQLKPYIEVIGNIYEDKELLEV